MAAVNHIKNRRAQRMRDVFEDFVARCLDGEDHVKVDVLLEMFENCFDEKELEKLNVLAGRDKKIPKGEFIEFCKSSSTVRNMVELESKGSRSRSGSNQGPGCLTPGAVRRLAKMDKAAVAFKVD